MVYLDSDGIYSGFVRSLEDSVNVRHGPGTFVSLDNQFRLEGVWQDNQAFNGEGVKEMASGDVYTGAFELGKFNGKVRGLADLFRALCRLRIKYSQGSGSKGSSLEWRCRVTRRQTSLRKQNSKLRRLQK